MALNREILLHSGGGSGSPRMENESDAARVRARIASSRLAQLGIITRLLACRYRQSGHAYGHGDRHRLHGPEAERIDFAAATAAC
jgi:hypothetical protein